MKMWLESRVWLTRHNDAASVSPSWLCKCHLPDANFLGVAFELRECGARPRLIHFVLSSCLSFVN